MAQTGHAEDTPFRLPAGVTGGLSSGLVTRDPGRWPLGMTFDSSPQRYSGRRLTGTEVGIDLALPLDGEDAQAATHWLEFSAGYSGISGGGTLVRRHDGDNMSFLSGTRPDGGIDLQTATDATGAQAEGDVMVTDPGGAQATIVSSAVSPAGQGAAVTQYAFSPAGDDSGAFLALTTDGDAPAAAAYGAIYSRDGFEFAATGDIEETTVRESVSERVEQLRTELLIGGRVATADDWAISLRAGPTLRRMTRHATTRTGITIAPTVPDASVPAVEITQHDRISADYLGALIGVGVSRAIGPLTTLSLDLRGGMAGFRATHRRRSEARIGSLGSGTHAQRADALSGSSLLAALSVSLSHQPAPNSAIYLSLYAEHMSDVPTLVSSRGGDRRTLALDTRPVNGAGISVGFVHRF